MVAQTANGNGSFTAQDSLCLELNVTDPEVIAECRKYEAGVERDGFAMSALRLGVLSLKQACGAIDQTVVRDEGERLLLSVRELMTNHTTKSMADLTGLLGKYFDSSNGELPQRLERLLKRDGDLESVLGRHLDGEASTLCRTLESHLGDSSPLLRFLSPEDGQGFFSTLGETLQSTCETQKEQILRQFSLDDKESALSRLVAELTDENGRLRKDFQEDLDRIAGEFSLDNEDGALCRLVSRVERAHRAIVHEFSPDNEQSVLSRISSLLEVTNQSIQASLTLDDENSPLSRLQRELLKVIAEQTAGNQQFQTEMRATLESFKARREEENRSTRHGLTYQDALSEYVVRESNRLNDVFEDTGDCAGSIPRCKKGDQVVTLGPESAAPGARVVFEAKSDKSYDLSKALNELQEAKQNRDAQVGVFVFSPAAAPEGMEAVARWGEDIVVVWDAEDATTDVSLKAAISIARAIVVQQRRQADESSAEFREIEKAIATISREAGVLDEISRMATTVKNNGEKIVKKAEKLKTRVDDQIETLTEHLSCVA